MPRLLIVSFSILIIFFPMGIPVHQDSPPPWILIYSRSSHKRPPRKFEKIIVTTVELVADQSELSYFKQR